MANNYGLGTKSILSPLLYANGDTVSLAGVVMRNDYLAIPSVAIKNERIVEFRGRVYKMDASGTIYRRYLDPTRPSNPVKWSKLSSTRTALYRSLSKMFSEQHNRECV